MHVNLKLDIEFSDSSNGEILNSNADFRRDAIEKNNEAIGIDGKQAVLPENKSII